MECGVHDQGVADSLAKLGNKDRDQFLSFENLKRIHTRVEKVRFFLDYLEREENIEREVYGLETSDVKIMPKLRSKYKKDESKVLKSAKKNYSDK